MRLDALTFALNRDAAFARLGTNSLGLRVESPTRVHNPQNAQPWVFYQADGIDTFRRILLTRQPAEPRRHCNE